MSPRQMGDLVASDATPDAAIARARGALAALSTRAIGAFPGSEAWRRGGWAGWRPAHAVCIHPPRDRVAAMYFETFTQMKKQLGQLDTWFERAVEHAKAKSFDPDLYLGFRLAPDQFAFARQVQTACDTAKLAASRLTGKDAPKFEDNEKTLAELSARVRATIAYLDGFTPQDFEGAAARVVTQPRWEGKTMTGASYFLQHAVPNFFFHLSQSYAILRHNGVSLGKRDYLGALDLRAP